MIAPARTGPTAWRVGPTILDRSTVKSCIILLYMCKPSLPLRQITCPQNQRRETPTAGLEVYRPPAFSLPVVGLRVNDYSGRKVPTIWLISCFLLLA